MKSALSQVRAVLRRRDRPVPADIAYRAYLVVMLGVIVLAPLVRGAALWLIEVLPLADGPWISQLRLGGGLALLILLPIVGWYSSPVRMSLPELDLLFTSALPRWQLLAGRVIRGSTFSVVIGAAISGLLIAVRLIQGVAIYTVVAPMLLTGVLAGAISYLLLLLGQLSRGTRWQALREQAARLDTVSALVITGDFRSAAGRVGAPVKLGRTWDWTLRWIQRQKPQRGVAQSGLLLFITRDALGIIRTPIRSFVALLGTIGGAVAVGTVLVTVGSGSDSSTGGALSGAVGGAVALLAAYASIGPWCRGLRTAGEAVGASPLLPYSVSGILLRHLVVPALVSALVCTGSAAIVARLLVGEAATHSSAAIVLSAGLTGLALSLIAVALRLLGSLKGPLPQSLLAPVPTPAGDLSAVNVMLWNLDGPILAATIGACLLALAVVSQLASLVFAIIALVALLLWSSIRLHSHQ